MPQVFCESNSIEPDARPARNRTCFSSDLLPQFNGKKCPLVGRSIISSDMPKAPLLRYRITFYWSRFQQYHHSCGAHLRKVQTKGMRARCPRSLEEASLHNSEMHHSCDGV